MNFKPLRWMRYKKAMILRHPAPPEQIAKAVACGVFSAFLLPVGHIPTAIAIAWMLRCSRVIAVAATIVHNPFMYAVSWLLQYKIGTLLVPGCPDWSQIQHQILHAPSSQELIHNCLQLGFKVCLAFSLGGLIIGTIGAFLAYHLTILSTRRFRASREHRRQARAEHHR